MAHVSRGTAPSSVLGSLSGTYTQLVNSDAYYQMGYIALNNSGVRGGAFLALDFETNTLTVITGASGVEAGQIHPQHIHGFPSGTPDARVPTIVQDDDRDGFVELAEGLDTYGPVLLNLTSPPGSGPSGFPQPDTTYFTFIETYDLDELTFDPDPSDATPGVPLSQILTAANLDTREMVLHGLTVLDGHGAGTGGEVNGMGGYKLVLPIASGEIDRVSGESVAQQFATARFEAGTLVVALDIQGNAGQAYRLYDIFDRDPDLAGITFHVESLDRGASLTDVARGFLLSDEFTFEFGELGSLSNETFVDVLFENVLEREGDAGGEAFWVSQLNAGISREAVFIGFTESTENQAQVAPSLQNGILLNDTILI